MSTNWQYRIDGWIDEHFAEMVDLRRYLHSHPEPSGKEYETTEYLANRLCEVGHNLVLGPDRRGIVVDGGGDGGGGDADCSRIAIRGDIDALRIHDRKKVPYASTRPGLMHACGHDGHATILWGVLGALANLTASNDLPWPVPYRGIFQPAEETCTGASEMIEAGALDGIGGIISVHVDPTHEVGQIGLREGILTANCDTLQISIEGRGGHAARPHETSDPIAAAAQLIGSIYFSVPRVTDSQEAVVVTIGQIIGGDNPNVVPEKVELRGTLRTLSRTVRRESIDHIRRIAQGIGQATETVINVQLLMGAHSVDNCPTIIDLFRTAGNGVVGSAGVFEIPRPSMGAEDFAYYLEHVPGAMMRLGCHSERLGRELLHTPFFDLDEESLKIGAKVLARTAVAWSDPARKAVLPQTPAVQ